MSQWSDEWPRGSPDTLLLILSQHVAEESAFRSASARIIKGHAHISTATYKAKKRKLVIFGEKFDTLAVLWIDGQEVKPKSHDSESFVVKALSLAPGTHDLRVANPDGGAASVTITVE